MKKLLFFAVALSILLLCACKPIEVKDQNFTVKVTVSGRNGANNTSLSDTIKHIVKNDVNERLVAITNQPLGRVDSIVLEFTTREGLPHPETYFSITTFDETVTVSGGGLFSNYRATVGDEWVRPRLGHMVLNELRYDDISDRKNVIRINGNNPFRIHGETFLFRKNDSDIVIPTTIPAGDRRCVSSTCLGTDTLSTIIFSTLSSAFTGAINNMDIPAVSITLKNGTGNYEMYLVPHVSAIPTSNRRIKGFGFIFKGTIEVKPLGLITSNEVDVYIPIFLAFERNSNTRYRVMLLPPNVSNILTVTDKVAVAATGLGNEQLAGTIRTEIVNSLQNLTPPQLIGGVDNDEIFSLLFDVLKQGGNIPDNFDVVALPTQSNLTTNKIIDGTGITARYEIVFLEK